MTSVYLYTTSLSTCVRYVIICKVQGSKRFFSSELFGVATHLLVFHSKHLTQSSFTILASLQCCVFNKIHSVLWGHLMFFLFCLFVFVFFPVMTKTAGQRKEHFTNNKLQNHLAHNLSQFMKFMHHSEYCL